MKRSCITALIVLMACLDPIDAPVGTYRFDPPEEYRLAWQRVEECSGLRGDFGRVHWHMVPGDRLACGAGWCDGAWKAPHEIYITEEQAGNSYSEYFVARHEMLHDLLGRPGHPEPFCKCDLWGPARGTPECGAEGGGGL